MSGSGEKLCGPSKPSKKLRKVQLYFDVGELPIARKLCQSHQQPVKMDLIQLAIAVQERP